MGWRQQSWPQERLQINQLRMVRLLNHNLSSKEVTFKSLNKLGNSEKLYEERQVGRKRRNAKKKKTRAGKEKRHHARTNNKEKIKTKEEEREKESQGQNWSKKLEKAGEKKAKRAIGNQQLK